MTENETFRIGGLVLDPARGELRRADEWLPIGAHALALLVCLCRNAPRVVSRKQLLSEAWPGLHVNDGSVRQAVSDVRAALGVDLAERIGTVRGKGYYIRLDPAVPDNGAYDAPPHVSRGSFLVGREAELQCMQRSLHSAADGQGQTVLITGAAGMGKTSLARRLAEDGSERGFVVLEARAETMEGAPPLWPWLRMLQDFLERAAPAQREELLDCAGRARALLVNGGDYIKHHGESAEQQRFLLFDDLRRVFVRISALSPLFMFVDDLHDLDEASSLFLECLARGTRRHPVLLVLASRPTTRRQNRALVRAVDALSREPGFSQIAPRNLTVTELTTLLAMRSKVELEEQLPEQIHSLTGGNPLFSCQVAQLCAASDQPSMLLTQTGVELQHVIDRRMRAGSELCTLCLGVASVWGFEFSRAELAMSLDAEDARLSSAIDEALFARFFVEISPTSRYRFAHPSMRETAYRTIPPVERRALHLRVAQAIEASGPEVVHARLYELAHHLFQTISPAVAERCAEYSRLAAERDMARTAFGPAAEHYRRALSALEFATHGEVPEQRLRLRLALGEALRSAGEPPASFKIFMREVGNEAAALGNAELVARAALLYTGQRQRYFAPSRMGASVDEAELQFLQQALDGLGTTHPEMRALLLSSKAYGLIYTEQVAPRELLLREAVALARTLEDPHTLARVLQVQIPTLSGRPERDVEQLCACHEWVDIAVRHNLSESELEARLTRAVTLLSMGDRKAAEQDFARITLLAERLGSPTARKRSMLRELYLAFWEGRIDEAERLSLNAYDAATSSDPVNEGVVLSIRIGAVQYLRTGPSAELLEQNKRMLESFPGTTGVHCVLAPAYASAGDFVSARREFDLMAAEGFRGVALSPLWLTEISGLGDAACTMRDAARASAVYEQLLPFCERIKVYGWQGIIGGPVTLDLGMLCLTMGRLDAAERWLLQARTRCRDLGAPLQEQLANCEYARLLTVRSGVDDRKTARRLLREAHVFGQARGIGLLTGRAGEGLSRLDRDGEARLVGEN